MERIHIYKQGAADHPVFLLLHGTGGSESDLIDIAHFIDAKATILSLRGEVTEDGLTRHSKRFGPMTFDQLDLNKRTHDLQHFIEWAAPHYGLDIHQIIGIGYSNGANLLASHMFRYPQAIKGAILFHPMSGGEISDVPNLFQLPIFIGAGNNDPICPPEMTADLQQKLQKFGANVSLSWHNYGHQLSYEEIQKAGSWYIKHFVSST